LGMDYDFVGMDLKTEGTIQFTNLNARIGHLWVQFINPWA